MLLRIMNSVSYQQLQLEFLNMIRSYVIVKLVLEANMINLPSDINIGYEKEEITYLNLLYAILFTTGHLGQFNPISYKIVVEDSENYSF